MTAKGRVGVVVLAAAFLLLLVMAAWAGKEDSDSPWIGVYTQKIEPDLEEAFDLDRLDGALIIDVMDDSPAEKAGLRRKDIIISLDGKKVDDPDMLISLVRDKKVGDEAEVVYIRKGSEGKASVVIAARPESKIKKEIEIASDPGLSKHFAFASGSDSYIGVAIQDLNEQLGEYFDVPDGKGILVTEVMEDSPAAKAGLKAGDVIVAADGETIAECDDLRELIGDKEEGDQISLEYLRRGQKMTVSMEVEENDLAYRVFDPSGMGNFGMQPFKWHGYYFDDEDLDTDFDREGYKEMMDDLKLQMEDLRKQLQELKSKMK